jgi:hypothetical protein
MSDQNVNEGASASSSNPAALMLPMTIAPADPRRYFSGPLPDDPHDQMELAGTINKAFQEELAVWLKENGMQDAVQFTCRMIIPGIGIKCTEATARAIKDGCSLVGYVSWLDNNQVVGE